MDLIIDAEFRDLFDKVRPEEADGLEASLLNEGGPLEPITVWKGHGIIIDGHRRYAICRKHNLPFQIREIDLPDRVAVKAWMRQWQLDRRNLTDRVYKNERLLLAAHLIGTSSTVEVVEKLKEECNVSDRTAYRDVSLATAITKIPDEIREDVIEKELPVMDMRVLSRLPQEKQVEIVKGNPHPADLSREIRRHIEVPEKKQKPTKPLPAGQAVKFHRMVRECQEHLGHSLRLVGDISDKVPRSKIDLQDCRRMLHQVDEIVNSWAAMYEGV